MTRQHLKDLASLDRTKGRRQHGLFLVEGVRSVSAALAAGADLAGVLVSADGRADDLADRARAVGVEVEVLAARDLDRIGDARTSQGVVAIARSIVQDHVDEISGPMLLLDGVQDPGNVGAIVRTAAWFGVQAVIASQSSADFEGPKAVRASMGGLWDLRLVRIPDLTAVLDARAETGAAVWGADLEGVRVQSWTPGEGAALVLGSEAHGLSESVRQRLTGAVSIPGVDAPRRGVESLNVAVAAGVLMSRWLG